MPDAPHTGWLSVSPARAGQTERRTWHGIAVERATARPAGATQFAFEGPRLMLRLGLSGRRADGETMLDGGARSTVRSMADRLHVALPGMRLSGWSVPDGGWSYATVSIDPAALLNGDDALTRRFAAIRPGLALRNDAVAATIRRLAALVDAPLADQLHADILARLLVVELAEPHRAPPLSQGGLSPAALRRTQDFLRDHLDRDVTLDAVAAQVGFSPWHFCRAFRDSTGLPPQRWLAQQRMEAARHMLAENRLSVIEIAVAVGFAGASQFSAAFRRHLGQTPSAYRAAIGATGPRRHHRAR